MHQLKPASALTWTADATLKIYKAGPDAERAFCSNCGSWVTWRSSNPAIDAVEFAIGTVDEIYLIGVGVEKVHTAADGDQQTIPKNGFGLAIANGMGTHSWTENEIPGVTDVMIVRGRKRKH